ncbi:hypothetical protein [Thalassotalea sp. G2M2-11]|uniref:hypothetical protein n=1 Tax=Thalassotalea sp. G2M2-11 TaxID=2787627 RepID=UPI0019D025AC|nr:hypothetical protein [Thalassotalea sp. G2M2-11]
MMNNGIKLLIVVSLVFCHLSINAKHITSSPKLSSGSHQVWNATNELKAQFIKKQHVDYLVITNAADSVIAEHLIPRAKNLANITWSADDQYVTFTENNRNLWLFNIENNAAKLIDYHFYHQTPLNVNVQWSADGQWLQYLSSNKSRHFAKVYSLARQRSYIVPVASGIISDIAWHDIDNELMINTVHPSQKHNEMSLYGIKMTVNAGDQIVQLNEL